MIQARSARVAAVPLAAGLMMVVAGCQTSQTETAEAAEGPTVETAAGDVVLPTELPPESIQLTNEELVGTFTDVAERYVSIDQPGMTASGFWLDGTMETTWREGDDSGTLMGAWYVDGRQLCVDYADEDGPTGTTECHAIYTYGDAYLSVNEDGGLHGYHALRPI